MQQIQSQEDLQELIGYMKAQGAPKEAMQKAVKDFMQSNMSGTMFGLSQMAKALPGALEIQQKAKPVESLKEKSPLIGSVAEKIMVAEPKKEELAMEQKVQQFREGELPEQKEAAEDATGFIAELPIAVTEKISKAPVNVANFMDNTPVLSAIRKLTLPTVSASEVEEAKAQIEQSADAFREMTGAERSIASEVLSDIVSYIIPAGGSAKAGAAALSKLGSFGKFLGASLGATTGVEIAREGDLPTMGEFAEGLAFDAATLGLGKAFNKLLPRMTADTTLTPKAIKNMQKAGLDNDMIKLMQVETDQDKKILEDLFEVGINRLEKGPMTGNLLTETPLDRVIGDLDIFTKGLKDNIDETGRAIGKAVDAAAEGQKTINLTQSVKPEIDSLLSEVNAVVDDAGVIDFSNSRLKRDTSGQKLLQEIYDFVNQGDASVKNIVEEYRSIGDELFRGKAKVELSKDADLLASKMRKLIQEPVVNIGGDLGKLNRKYSELLDLEFEIKKSFGDDPTEVPSVLRRMFGNNVSAKKINNLFQDINALSKELGLTEGTDLGKKTGLAIALQDVLDIKAPTGLAPTIESAVKKGPTAALVEKGLDIIFQKPEVADAVKAFISAPVGTKEQIGKAIFPQLNKIDPKLVQALRAILSQELEE